MRNLKIIILFIISITLLSCSKDDDETITLPTGENTAYYYLDGQLIIPKGVSDGFGSSPIKPITVSIQPLPVETLELGLNDSGLQDLNIFFANGINNIGNIKLNYGNSNCCNNINNMGSIDYRSNKTIPWKYYQTNIESGYVDIEYLSANKRKISGTFQMDVFSTTGEVKHITNGHFNINLDTL